MFALRLVAFCALTAALSGCAEYMDRKDTIAFNAGEAVQTNQVTHIIDPWPLHAANKDIAFSGERMARVAERYGAGPGGRSGGGGAGGSGPCNTPGDIASDGSRCGGRAASERPGGRP